MTPGQPLRELRERGLTVDLLRLHQQAKAGPVATNVPTVANYMTYWLGEIVEPNLAPLTYATYETLSRLYILPGLGAKRLDGRLSVREVHPGHLNPAQIRRARKARRVRTFGPARRRLRNEKVEGRRAPQPGPGNGESEVAAMRGIRKGVVVLGTVLVGLLAVPAAASADMGSTGADFGGHVATCTQDMGFDGQHNPGMHQGYANWDMTHMG